MLRRPGAPSNLVITATLVITGRTGGTSARWISKSARPNQRSTHPMNYGAYTGWHKSSHSSGTGNCVEVAVAAGRGVSVRDTKQRGRGPVLEFTAAQWTAFVRAAKAGQFER